MINDQEREVLAALMEEVAGKLSEHCDSVRIVCSSIREDGSSQYLARGRGNWYAQYGSVREWLLREEEIMRLDEREERGGGEIA